MSVHESSLTTRDVLDDQVFSNTLKNSRAQNHTRSDSYQTEPNPRRNSLQAKDVLPESLINSPPPTMTKSESCQRCSGEGEVAKPCGHCKATGTTNKAQPCTDCQAEKYGCGNMNCDTCHGVGRVIARGACEGCGGSGSGLKLTCGDCGGSGSGSPVTRRSSTGCRCGSIDE